jgi:hypothetical protein
MCNTETDPARIILILKLSVNIYPPAPAGKCSRDALQCAQGVQCETLSTNAQLEEEGFTFVESLEADVSTGLPEVGFVRR